MTLTIKDPEAERLAIAIARATGETTARAVTQALRERHARLARPQGRASAAELRAIAAGVAAPVKGPYRDHAEELYGESGLPE